MAQKQIAIGIKITSEGQEKVISNLQGLETELTALQAKLKTLDFGSKAFQETTANIQKLRSKIDDIDKATEGLGAEKRFNALNASVGVLISSFQILSGVIGIFVSNSENLEAVQRAEAQALGVLNTALGIFQIKRELADNQITLSSIKQKALTAITTAATAVQTAFNAALAANPIGLVVAALGALTLAYAYFTSGVKKATLAVDELKVKEDELGKITKEGLEIRDEELKKVIPLIALTEKETISKENRNKAIKAIQQQYPDYLKNQDLEKLSLEDIKTANDDLIESVSKLARSRAALNELTRIYTEELKLQQTAEERAIGRERALQDAYKTGRADVIQGTIQVNKSLEAVAAADRGRQQKTLDIQKKVALSYIDEADAVKSATTALNGNTTAQQKNNQVADQRLIAIQNQISLINKLKSAVDEYGKTDLKVQSEILQKQQQVIDEQVSYLESVADKLQSGSNKIIKELQETFFKIIPSEKDAEALKDGYADLFKVIDEAILAGEIEPKDFKGFQSYVDFAEKKLPGIKDKLVNVSEEGKLSFIDYFDTLETRVQALKGIYEGASTFGEILFIPDASIEQLKALREIEELYAKQLVSRVDTGEKLLVIDNQIKQSIASKIKLSGDELSINDRIAASVKEIKTLQADDIKLSADDPQKKVIQDRITALNELIKSYEGVANSIFEQLKSSNNFVLGLREVGNEAEKNTAKIEANKAAINAPIKPEALQGVKEYFEQNADGFATIFTDIFNNADKYLEKFGKDGVMAIFSGVEEGINDIEGMSRAELEKLSAYLKIVGEEFANQFGLQNNPFIKLLNEIEKKLKELPTKTEESFTKTIENIREVADVILEVFNQILGQMNTFISAQNSLLLEQLQYKQEQALAIIGEANTESEKENKKIDAERLKVQKEFAKQRFEIEKKARIQELQFALATALATGANAVLNALALQAPPPIPILYAGVVGGLTIAQAAIIRDQIQFTQSKAFVGRRGGLIMGESHEGANGGVPALLEGGEFVVNKEGVRQFGDIISQINNSTGGRALTIDDSRIVQAIASQNTGNKQPLKAYVLYNDIQDTTKLNQKITQLARL